MKKEVLIKILSGIDDDFVFEIVPEICDSCSGEKKSEMSEYKKKRAAEIVLPYVALAAAFIVIIIVLRGIRSEFKTGKDKNNKVEYDLSVKAYVPEVEDDAANNVNFDSEIDIWNNKNINGFIEPDGQAEYFVEFLGKEYTGIYVRTFCSFWQYENYLRKEYETTDGTFAINAKNGKLVYYSGAKIQLFDHDISKDEAVDRFNEIADEYVSNKENYEFSINEFGNLDKKDYYMLYSRKLNGIKTSEKFTMGFSSEGTCSGMSCVMLDEFKKFYGEHDEEEINAMTEMLTSDEAIKQLEEKLVSIYGEYDSYEIVDKTYTLLEDGSLALVCIVGINPVYNENGKKVSEYYGTGVEYYEKGEAFIILSVE